jgi:general secretion pathway protein F
MSRLRPLPLQVRAQLFQHLAAMEKAGMPAEKSYALLDLGPAARERADTFRRLFARAVDPPTAGANSGLFTIFEARLLRAAFAAGSPLAVYERLARHHALRASQMAALRARLVLPAAILTLALLVQPLPRLFSGAMSMPGYAARTILPLLIIGALAMLGMHIAAWFTSGARPAWRPALERSLLALPLFGRLHLRRNARDFNESLAMLLEAGLGMLEALPLALATVDNHIVRADLASLLPSVKSGATLAQAVCQLRLIDTTQLFAFVLTGEESGTLPEMLMRHADAESAALAQAQQELFTWLPRVLYGLVAAWMAFQLLAPRAASDIAALGVPQYLS